MVGGSTNVMTCSGWNQSDINAGLEKSANYSNVGNNRLTGTHFKRMKKVVVKS